MGKRIIFCADGTWDSPQNKTNVYKIWQAVRPMPNQAPFYDDGVGADGSILDRLLDGATGAGLFQKIRDGYKSIAQSYQPGDDIYLFGFSRGAYTARSLAGMIAICGLPTRPCDENLVQTAFQAYRNKDKRAALLAGLAGYAMYDAKIRMVGVWDTVGALGIPAVIGGVDPALYGFLDTSLHPDVKNAFHAVAIDERRREFPATLWTSTPAADQKLEQIYFVGVHCDVGGGYTEAGLSDITLSWMMNRANQTGLQFTDAAWDQYKAIDPKHALDEKHESWKLIWGFPKRRTIADDARLSNSVAIRCAHDPTYRPPNLNLNADGTPSATYTFVPVVANPDA